ncbi:hypothetical protein QFZ60_001294 [Arthrobacter sp. B2I5]|jgi:hypothetical protein|nr:hypothetical protein [Arthrobacter sp. B2I5]
MPTAGDMQKGRDASAPALFAAAGGYLRLFC